LLPAPADGSKYEFLDVAGKGHYVGSVLSVVQAEAGWFGEGDDFFWVDGEKYPSIEGTGSEDYFNDAWGLHEDDGPLYGVSVAEGTDLGSRMTAFRWHVLDPVPFTKSLKVEIEHRGWTYDDDGKVKSAFGIRTDLMSSVAFWYQDGIAMDQPPVPYGSARLPQGNAEQIEVERHLYKGKKAKLKLDGKVETKGGKASISPELFWSKDVILFKAEGPGSEITIPFDVAEEGDYEIYTEVAQASDYGIYQVLLDGEPPVAGQLEHEPGADLRPRMQFDGYALETFVGYAHLVGWPNLTEGRHTLTFVCLGKREASAGYNLGVDNIILAKIGKEAWAAASKVKEPRISTGNIVEISQSLSDPDPVVRGLAATALRDKGKESLPALTALIPALKDKDANVRLMSANAIAAIGPEAADAVPALIKAAKVKEEDVQVLRSYALALGAIGKPAAEPSIPALKKLLKIPRVRWAAEAALKKLGETIPEEKSKEKSAEDDASE
jgi:hypothetical protein